MLEINFFGFLALYKHTVTNVQPNCHTHLHYLNPLLQIQFLQHNSSELIHICSELIAAVIPSHFCTAI